MQGGGATPLRAQTRTRLAIGTAGTKGVFYLYPLGVGVAGLISRYTPGIEATAEVAGPKGTYTGVDDDVSVVARAVLFVAHERLDERLAYEITKLILERTEELVAAHEVAKEITLKSAVLGFPTPFHPGALGPGKVRRALLAWRSKATAPGRRAIGASRLTFITQYVIIGP